MEYAEAMSQTPPMVTDELSARLLEQLGAAALVELSAFIGLANFTNPQQRRSRHPVAGVLCGLRAAAVGRAEGRRTPRRMNEDPFVTHRNLLFTVAYEMLGSAVDAEDVVQETWLRWAGIDHEDVRHPRAYLVRIATRQALDRLRTLSRRREVYTGPWLPEPLMTAPDVADDVELAESVSIAMLTVLETLRPTERAVFVLREVFAFPYDEIAEAVDKNPPAVRQIAHRAREHVASRRPHGVASVAETRAALDAFQQAVETGELQGLVDVLAPDVVALSDGGGVKQAFPRPVVGADKVVRLFAVGLEMVGAKVTVDPVQINGAPALVMRLDGHLDSVVAVRVEDGLVTGLYVVRNPEKLSRVGEMTALSR